MEPTRLVIDIPAIPLTEALLVLIACLLYRACNLLSEIARSNKQLVQRSEVHAGEPEARQRRPTPQPLADGRAGSSSSDLERLRPIMVSAEAFEKCLLGEDDVQVPHFMAACKCYCNVLNVIGPFTLITVREVHANMAKIDTSLQLDAVAYRSMRALLTAEVDAGMHQGEEKSCQKDCWHCQNRAPWKLPLPCGGGRCWWHATERARSALAPAAVDLRVTKAPFEARLERDIVRVAARARCGR